MSRRQFLGILNMGGIQSKKEKKGLELLFSKFQIYNSTVQYYNYMSGNYNQPDIHEVRRGNIFQS